jgi:hypothetical protein
MTKVKMKVTSFGQNGRIDPVLWNGSRKDRALMKAEANRDFRAVILEKMREIKKSQFKPPLSRSTNQQSRLSDLNRATSQPKMFLGSRT